MTEIDTVILAGGRGTRLQSVVGDRPKPMAEIKGRPFLDFVIDNLVRQGLRHFILSVGHMRDQIITHYSKRLDAEFSFCEEEQPLGTGGAIRNALARIKGDQFLVLNGDSLCKVDIQPVFDLHKRKNAFITMVVSRACDRHDAGMVVVNQDSTVTTFAQHAAPQDRATGLNAGIYVIQNDPAELNRWGAAFSLEQDAIPYWVSAHQCAGYVTNLPLIDIGTPERYVAFLRRH